MSASLSANKRFRLDTLAEEPLSLEVGIEELGNVSVRALMSLGLSITEAEVTARSLLFGQSWQSTSGYNDKGELMPNAQDRNQLSGGYFLAASLNDSIATILASKLASAMSI